MGWLKKLPFLLLYLPLSSSVCAAIATEIAIAAPDREHCHPAQSIARNTLPDFNATAIPRPLTAATLSFNSEQFDRQLQRYLRFVAQAGPPDILIVGSSRALQGIDPIVLQQTLSSRGYSKLRIFNVGINGATAQLVDLLLRQILTLNQLPRLIVWGDGARAFNSGRIDITYNRAIASQGYQLLGFGIRPTLLTESLPMVQPCAAFSLKLSAYKSTHQPKSFNVVPLLDPALRQPQLCWAALKMLLAPEPLAKPETLPSAELQDTTGFQSVSDQFKPNQYFQRYPQVRGKYDADYRDFTLEGKQTEAFANVVKFAKTRQIPVVFVNLPLTQIYLDETRTVNETQFRVYLQRFARSHALSVHDLSQRWLNQNDYFTDPSHLNRFGAAAVATELGKALVLPRMRPLWLK
ncbi:MAG: hypothetical protein KME42_16350 [Tildeniella nuda ZEHNDER 1965/U140]|jgi:hypothetical protein|nr:hypothetical protein [Tildeniella nuda ZEHNDER 1965/U140]